MAGEATAVNIVINEDSSVTISDDGVHPRRGAPPASGMSDARSRHDCSPPWRQIGGGGYQISSGLHGVGVSVVNAPSEWCQVEVKHDGHLYSQRYDVAFPVTELLDLGPAKVMGHQHHFFGRS